MRLQASGFKKGDGGLKGILVAVDDRSEPLGWESSGNWSSSALQERAIKGLAATLGITLDRARVAIAQALKEARQQVGLPSVGMEPLNHHDRPSIVVTGRQPRDVETDAWTLLRARREAGPEFFALGSTLVHLEFAKGGPYLHPLTLAGLRRHLQMRANFVKLGERGESPTTVPRTTLEDILAVSEPPLPAIHGVTMTPMLAPSGFIVSKGGYDPSLGLYLSIQTDLPNVPSVPSSGDVEQAKAIVLDELLGDFPFASDADRAHAVSALLTPIIRAAVNGATPLHLIEAPSPGTGKGLLVQITAIVVAGAEVAVMTEARDDDEWRKRITAKLRTGPPLVLMDNVRRLDSAALSSALTEPIWEDRELGANRMLRFPIRCTWMATGNNPALSLEMSRRVVRTRLDSRLERPWERRGFRHHPLEGWARQHRGEVLWALLTLVQAWLANGRPPGTTPMGRFQEWADIVGGILGVAQIPGFLDNRGETYAQAAAEGEGWRALIEAWAHTYHGQRVGVDVLFDLARQRKLLTELRAGRTDQGARVALGRELSGLRDRVIGSHVVRFVGIGSSGGLHYRLETMLVAQESSVSSASSVQPDSDGSEDTEDTDDFPTTQLHEGKTVAAHDASTSPGAGVPEVSPIPVSAAPGRRRTII